MTFVKERRAVRFFSYNFKCYIFLNGYEMVLHFLLCTCVNKFPIDSDFQEFQEIIIKKPPSRTEYGHFTRKA